MNHAGWDSARELLCVRLDAIGDVLMTGPAIRALRGAGDGRRITLLTSPAGARAGELMPGVDELLVYEAPWMKATAPRDAAPDHALVSELRARGFDAAAIFTVYSQSPLPAALTCHLAGIPLRLAHCRENPYQLLTDWVPEPEPHELVRHEVRRQLDLVAAVGAHTEDERLAVALPEPARADAHRVLAELGLEPGGRWAAVHPGSTAPSRRYPPQSYVQACDQLVLDKGIEVAFTGDGSELDLIESIRAGMAAPSHVAAGRLGVAGVAALLDSAAVLVAGNTGPVHIAAAVGTPVVDLYAMTNPQHTPWGVPNKVLSQDVPCRWCYKSICPEGHHLCLRGVPPEAVADAAAELIEFSSGSTTAPNTAWPGELKHEWPRSATR